MPKALLVGCSFFQCYLLPGYLPSFWIKLRLMGAPALNSTVVHGWPVGLYLKFRKHSLD